MKREPVTTFAIDVYAGAAGLVLDSTSGADKDAILDALDRLEAGGSTGYADVAQLARMGQGPDLEGFREEFLGMIDSAKTMSGRAVAAK